MNKISRIAGFLAKCALVCSALLLLSNFRFSSHSTLDGTGQFVIHDRAHDWLSSAPLALIGVAYVILQIRVKPDRRRLLKRLLLAGTFILWAIDQLLPSGRLATLIGDAVVAAYVLDLFWIIEEQEAARDV